MTGKRKTRHNLTEAEALSALRRASLGERTSVIARDLNVSGTAVQDIFRKKGRWKNLPSFPGIPRPRGHYDRTVSIKPGISTTGPYRRTGEADPKKRIWDASTPEPNTGCWLWELICMAKGRWHGMTRVGGVKMGAHRASWLAYKGPIPPGMQVLHKCDQPSCVNPDHLYLGNYYDNMHDMRSKGRNLKLLPYQVDEIVQLREAGETYASIAKKYGVIPTTIARAVSRHRALSDIKGAGDA